MGVKIITLWNRIPELMVAVEAASRAAPKHAADKIAADARALAPVDTGALRASIRSTSVESGKTAEVRVGAEYAAYVEFGTYKMRAQPYLTPAVEANKSMFTDELLKPLKG